MWSEEDHRDSPERTEVTDDGCGLKRMAGYEPISARNGRRFSISARFGLVNRRTALALQASAKAHGTGSFAFQRNSIALDKIWRPSIYYRKIVSRLRAVCREGPKDYIVSSSGILKVGEQRFCTWTTETRRQ